LSDIGLFIYFRM